MRKLVGHKADQFVHVNIDRLQRDCYIAWLTLERTRVIHRHELTGAIVARYLAFELRVVRLSDHHSWLFEALLLFGRFYDYVRLDEFVVGYELTEVLAAAKWNHSRRLGLELGDQAADTKEFGFFEHVEGFALGWQVVTSNKIQNVSVWKRPNKFTKKNQILSKLTPPEMFPVTVDKKPPVLVPDNLMSSAKHHRQHGIFVFCESRQTGCE